MEKHVLGWGIAAGWVSFCCYFISQANLKLSVSDLLLMMPQWCEMTNLNGSSYVVLSPQDSLRYCFVTLLLLFFCWYITVEDDVEAMTSEASSINEYVKTKINDEEKLDEVLLENAKSLLDIVDLEYKHCAATIASNNETHGKKVGGEAEWATGETSSEDEDATREITGARVRKGRRETEEAQIIKFHQQPLDDCVDSKIEYEPNLSDLSSELPKQEELDAQL